MTKRPSWLGKSDTIAGLYAEAPLEQGLVPVLWAVVLDGDKKPRIEALYFEDLSDELLTLFPIASAVHGQLMRGLKRHLNRTK